MHLHEVYSTVDNKVENSEFISRQTSGLKMTRMEQLVIPWYELHLQPTVEL